MSKADHFLKVLKKTESEKKTLKDEYTFLSNLTMPSPNPESVFPGQILFSRKFSMYNF
jgi:hypothetical protein